MKVQDHSTRIELTPEEVIRIAEGGRVEEDGLVIESTDNCMDRVIISVAEMIGS